jgi:hypothetical protein
VRKASIEKKREKIMKELNIYEKARKNFIKKEILFIQKNLLNLFWI